VHIIIKMKSKVVKIGFVMLLTAGCASAQNAAAAIAAVICGLVPEAINLAWALAILVFVYGGAKYAYSADDPGGRKQGKNIAINALIGFVIVGASSALVKAIAGSNPCP
jgi:hypothetical protein